MPTPFPSTLAFLEADEASIPRRIVVGVGALLLGWALWLTLSKTPVYAVSNEGRLLAAGAASPVQSPVAGLVAETHLVLGAELKTGDVLVELDATTEKLRREEEQARLLGINQAIESLDQIIRAERGLASATERSFQTRITSAAAKAHAASEVLTLTQEQDEAIRKLKAASLVSNLEALKAAEDLQRQRGQLGINRAETALAAADYARAQKETKVRLLNLERELTELKTRSLSTRAVLAQLDWEIERRKLRSPLDGTIADVRILQKGSAVSINDIVATVAPKTAMRWVAYFPAREVGRIRTGQHARIRLDAFPWTAYGLLSGRITAVGSEARDQRVRVELDVTNGSSPIPLIHGMTGATDVEVETLAPIRLLLRLAGQMVQENRLETPVAPESSAAPPP